MSSRLDRLFVLLDTGSSAVTRKAAALQLGEVQKLHPHELHNLLAKLHNFLQSNIWDTRIAAGQAVEAIASNVPQWDPSGTEEETDGNSATEAADLRLSQAGRMKFDQFDVNTVLKNGACLLGSEGKEYEIEEEPTRMEEKEQLARQRQKLNKRLGLDVAQKVGLDTSDIFSNDDLLVSVESAKHMQTVEITKKALADAMQSEVYPGKSAGLSSREINRAKRKAKLIAKQRSRETQEASASAATSNNNGEGEEPEVKKRRTSSFIKVEDSDCLEDKTTRDVLLENSSLWEETGEWPFEGFCDQLSQDLFSPSWEIRHGSATALREIVRMHGKGAGKSIDVPVTEMTSANQLWLEDMALRLLCVLALDRFGDFISDQVVAPVRETCAQTLASILNFMNRESVQGVTRILLQLLRQKEWEARHGGLLGMKYLLAVRNDMTSELLRAVYPPIFGGLQDAVDDVCAVAASALVPVSDALVKDLPEQVPLIIATLWDSLLDQDDLTTSTNSLMTLLASLLSHPVSSTHYSPSQPLNELVPRLWPFLSHNSSAVRKASLQTLCTLTRTSSTQLDSTWLSPIITDVLRHIFQRALLETVPELLDLLYQVWQQLLVKAPLDSLLRGACPYLSSWLCLLMQPSRQPIPADILLQAKHKAKFLPHHVLGVGFINVLGNSPAQCPSNSYSSPSLVSSVPIPMSDEQMLRHSVRLFITMRRSKDKTSNRNRNPVLADTKESQEKRYIGGTESLNDSGVERERIVIRAKFVGARMLGLLSCYITKQMPGVAYTDGMESPVESYGKLLLFHLNSKSALQRLAIALVVRKWAEDDTHCHCSQTVQARLLECLNENIYFDEIALPFTRMQHEYRELLSVLRQHRVNLDSLSPMGSVIAVEQALVLCTTSFPILVAGSTLSTHIQEALEEKRKALLATATQTNLEQSLLSTSVQAAIAGAVIALECLPEKLNPVIKPLMDSVRKEDNELLQELSAKSLTKLLDLCISRPVCPNSKIVKNICNFMTSDPYYTPQIAQPTFGRPETGSCNGERSYETASVSLNSSAGIITLKKLQKVAEKSINVRRSNSVSKNKSVLSGSEVGAEDVVIDDETQRQNELQRRGAQFVLAEMARRNGSELSEKLPKVWEATIGLLQDNILPASSDAACNSENDTTAQDLVNGLQVFEAIGPYLHEALQPQIINVIPHLCACIEHTYAAVRHMASRCMGMLSKKITVDAMVAVVDHILPLLGSSDNDICRQGAVECLANIIECLGFDIVPYIVLLVVPVLGRMSDPNQDVRLMATHCFATLVRLMPLEGGIPDPPNLHSSLIEKKQKERKFLEQLFDIKSLENYKVPVPVDAELRSYQQDGINWLAFLNRYKLHGILCDDMGLGKTLQSLCILAGDHYYRSHEYKTKKSADCIPLPSLVVCPPTLTGHWVYEVEKFVAKEFLHPLHYTGPPAERLRLRSKAKKHNLIIASYDIVRNDIDFFSNIHWNYCILDEGHIIKNGKTKLSKAIKQLSANHRLILSGTPIQNNVLELWSLFDFLMPGFLGTEKQFIARYSKPILLSRDAKSSSREQEAGALAMESLHRQALPFLLRRMKEDVLQDLPPKIIQDYYCELSTLQEQLYEDFSKSRAKKSLEESLSGEETNVNQGPAHIFQALQYLRKVCNHPKLVVNEGHPEFPAISKRLKEQNSTLSDIHHAAKLPALKQLLLDCGIGVDSGSEPVVNQHRALIFCQLKSMLDILERDLFKIHLPTVSYLRLDGSISPGARYSVVHRFNSDPSLDVLLLTTQVGGLGLNLTGADTVIFVEHDWNPMKDLQAMDRAHRIGQKKVVNVYRLITKGTLEEKIMGLQKFKLTIANTVISQDNSSLRSMGTDQLLDLFTVDTSRKNTIQSSTTEQKSDTLAQGGKRGGVNTMLEGLPDLWDEKQYETEYDLSNFLQNLRK